MCDPTLILRPRELEKDCSHCVNTGPAVLGNSTFDSWETSRTCWLKAVQTLEYPSQAVDASIEQNPSSKIRIDHDVGIVLETTCVRQTVFGQNPFNRTNFARLDDLADVEGEGKVSSPEPFHQEQVLLSGLLSELPGLLGVHGKCRLAEHVLACFKTKHGVLIVVRVRCGNIDDFNIRVLNELGIGAVGLGVRWSIAVPQELFRSRL